MFTFLNGALLFGLGAIAIPPIMHLLNRKRFDVIDWAAMQFLQISEQTRRKVFLEEMLLMLVRMGLLALLVFGLAAPITESSWLAQFAPRSSRDVVVIIDGSASMAYRADGLTPLDQAKSWTLEFLDQLQRGDGVGLVLARQSPTALVPGLTPNHTTIREALQTLPSPRGSADWPASVQAAMTLLRDSKQPVREIVILSDGQRQGWSDDRTRERFELLIRKFQSEQVEMPRIWLVDVAGERTNNVPNWSLADIRTSRSVAVVGREVRFRTALMLSGDNDVSPPAKLPRQVDERPAGEIAIPNLSALRGQIPLSFPYRFAASGYHLLSLELPDDALPGDNRQDYAIEVVPAIPVLLVDGDTRPAVKERGTDFLRDALAPSRDPSPAYQVQTVSIDQFDGARLQQPIGKEPSSIPRWLILSNVARLTPDQQRGIERFLQNGGSVFITLGDRVDAAFYNAELYRNGQGWLPAKLGEVIGDVNELAKAARPQAASFNHPIFDLFRDSQGAGLESAYFPRHWRIETPTNTPGVTIAVLSDRDPWLAERAVGKGKVIVASVPFDNSWRSNLTDLPDYPLLVHELGYYLAGTGGIPLQLSPGQPIIFQPMVPEQPRYVTLRTPGGTEKAIDVGAWPFTYEDTREPGVYHVKSAAGQSIYYVVRPDTGESEWKQFDDQDRAELTKRLPAVRFARTIPEVMDELQRDTGQQELWWLLMLGVMMFLLMEIAMTRRIATGNDRTRG